MLLYWIDVTQVLGHIESRIQNQKWGFKLKFNKWIEIFKSWQQKSQNSSLNWGKSMILMCSKYKNFITMISLLRLQIKDRSKLLAEFETIH